MSVEAGYPLICLCPANSEDFGHVNAFLQEVAAQLVQHQACAEMVTRYPEALVGLELPYSFPGVTMLVLQLFFELTNFNYSLSKTLEGNDVDTSSLKKQLEEIYSFATSSDK